MTWIKAQASISNSACIELAEAPGGVWLRDSKDPDGPKLFFTHAELAAFLDGAKKGEFDGLLIREAS